MEKKTFMDLCSSVGNELEKAEASCAEVLHVAVWLLGGVIGLEDMGEVARFADDLHELVHRYEAQQASA